MAQRARWVRLAGTGARAKGIVGPLPYALLTLGTGSLGLLLYRIGHDGAARERAGNLTEGVMQEELR